jgi:hypothetical protein
VSSRAAQTAMDLSSGQPLSRWIHAHTARAVFTFLRDTICN